MAAEPMNPPPPTAPAAREVRQISTQVRYRQHAESRVQEYLKSYGLVDPERLQQLTTELVPSRNESTELAAQAVAEAQRRVENFLQDLLPKDVGPPKPLWLRAFIEAHPEHFLGELIAARAAASEFGDAAAGEPPHTKHFAPQPLPQITAPRWLLGLIAPLTLTAIPCILLLSTFAQNDLSALELLFVLGFAGVFIGPAIGLSTAVLGFFSKRSTDTGASAAASSPTAGRGELPRSAVIMPIYHEDPEAVFAAVAAMRESLSATPGGQCLDFFVLSDTRDLRIAADEERAFRRICGLPDAPDDVRVYYRRRTSNSGQKAGNVAEFCERYGDRYRYAIVLDADSLMSGATMVEMVRRMEASPKLGLLQADLQLRGGRTPLSMGQQLVASTCGPLFMRGLARWAGPHGNYYGHNAIVRVRAFLECCALPVLPGPPPFGGHFLSHDFVEAAQLCRAGWEVRAGWDLQESWEEMPHTLAEYSARDRRWCQGNLQHLRIVLAQGLQPMSRIHLLVGALGYLTGPGLLCFLALGQWVGHSQMGLQLPPHLGALLLILTGSCLGLPRVLGLLETLFNPQRRRLHGGALRLLLGVFVEAALSVVTAPILMVHHTRTVLAIITGGTVGWGGRKRDSAGGSWLGTVWMEWPTMALGLICGAALLWFDRSTALWLAPCWVPMLCAGPTAALLSSERVGGWARTLGLFSTPSDLCGHPLLERAKALRPLTAGDEGARFRDLVLDPLLLASHLETLAPEHQAAAGIDLLELRERALRMGPAALTPPERERLTQHAESMRWLHQRAWQRWPVESWRLLRDHPHAPRA